MDDQNLDGLKSALEKTKEKLRLAKDENAALRDRVAKVEEAFDFLVMATALRNHNAKLSD